MWKQFEMAMGREADGIKEALDEAVEIAKGNRKATRVHRVPRDQGSAIDVKSIRETLEMTQAEFSDAFGIPKRTVEKWEQRDREPDAAARSYLNVIRQDPKAVRRALRKSES